MTIDTELHTRLTSTGFHGELEHLKIKTRLIDERFPSVMDECGSLFYYESRKREIKTRLTYEDRCDERLNTKDEESTRLGDTGLLVELEHLKIETRLIDEMFASVMGEYVFLK